MNNNNNKKTLYTLDLNFVLLFICFSYIRLTLLSSNGIDLFNITNRITPSDHISDIFGSYGIPFRISGAAYDNDPQYVALSNGRPEIDKIEI